MIIKDVICKDCGCQYEIDDLGMAFILHYNNQDIESDNIKCPECGSEFYSEISYDNNWEE